MTTLRDGTTTIDGRLGRLRQQDPKSLRFLLTPTLEADEKRPRSFTWSVPVRLDQGVEGACVGFGWSHELAGRPVKVVGVNNGSARALYHDMQRDDEWDGGAYPGADPRMEGTSVLAGARLLQSRGLILEYRWAKSTDELALGVGYKGPAVLGVDWWDGMYHPDSSGFIHPSGNMVGGHCLIANRVRMVWASKHEVDRYRSWLGLLNSWGPEWGDNGACKITFSDFDRLIPAADMCIPVRRAHGATAA